MLAANISKRRGDGAVQLRGCGVGLPGETRPTCRTGSGAVVSGCGCAEAPALSKQASWEGLLWQPWNAWPTSSSDPDGVLTCGVLVLIQHHFILLIKVKVLLYNKKQQWRPSWTLIPASSHPILVWSKPPCPKLFKQFWYMNVSSTLIIS